jgi:hypothetical protein
MRMRLSLGAILAPTWNLAAMAWGHAAVLWTQIEWVRTHPVVVRVTVASLHEQVISIQRDVKDDCATAQIEVGMP